MSLDIKEKYTETTRKLNMLKYLRKFALDYPLGDLAQLKTELDKIRKEQELKKEICDLEKELLRISKKDNNIERI